VPGRLRAAEQAPRRLPAKRLQPKPRAQSRWPELPAARRRFRPWSLAHWLGRDDGSRCGFLLGAAVLFDAALGVLDGALALVFLATASFLARAQAIFLGLALEASNALLRSLVGRRRTTDRRRRRDRPGCGRRRGNGLGRGSDRFGGTSLGTGFTRLADQLAPLHLDHDLVGPAVAEGLLDLASLDRPLQSKRLASEGRLVVGLAHKSLFALRINSSLRPRARLLPVPDLHLRQHPKSNWELVQ
jgi:hypothetical protein